MQSVGRTASGLPLTDQRFATLPPHFIVGEPLLEDTSYKQVIGAFGSLPKCFQPVLPYLVASLAHHSDFLVENLPSTHPLFKSRIWTSGLLTRLRDRVLSGCGENVVSQMTATGVSPTLVLANQLDKLTSTVNGMITTAAVHKEELMSAWKDGFDALPNLVSSHIRDTLEITGAVTVTQADVFRIVTAAFESYAPTLQQTIIVPSTTAAALPEARVTPAFVGSYFESRWRFYTWADESQQYFPEDFVYPSSMTVSTLWDKWYFSGVEEQAPYRKLSSLHVSSGGKSSAVARTQKSYLSKSKGIMDELVKILKETGSIAKVSELYSISYDVSRVKFGECFLILVKKVYGVDDEVALDNMRIGELKYNTLYDNWKKLTSKKRSRQEIENNDESISDAGETE